MSRTSTSRQPVRDQSLLVTVCVTAVLLCIGFAGAWFYQQHKTRLRTQVFFSRPVSVTTGTRTHSVAASFVIRTRRTEAGWADDNRHAMEQVVQSTLASADLDAVLRPGGLSSFQSSLRNTLNTALHTDKVEEVLLTDFLVGDSSD